MSDWQNRARKVSVMFPANMWQQPLKEMTDEVEQFPMPFDINAKIANALLTYPTVSEGHHKKPRINCNITWRKHPQFKWITIPQILYDSSDESRLFKIIEKYGGKIVDNDLRMIQCGKTETSPSGKEDNFENISEFLRCKDFNNNIRR